MHLPTLLSLAGLFLSAPLLATAAPHHTSGMTPTQRQRRATHHGLSRRQSQASPSAGPTLCVLQCPVADQNNVGSTSQDTDGEGNLVCQYDRNQPACVYSNPAGQAMGGNAASCPVAAQRICPNRKRDPRESPYSSPHVDEPRPPSLSSLTVLPSTTPTPPRHRFAPSPLPLAPSQSTSPPAKPPHPPLEDAPARPVDDSRPSGTCGDLERRR